MDIRFLSGDKHKVSETQAILRLTGINVISTKFKIEEIQTQDVQRLVHDKVLKAFERVGRPVFVEHTSIYLTGLNGLPGGLTQIFWDRLEAAPFVSLVKSLPSRDITAKTVIGYCDSRNIHYFEGEVSGTVADAPTGPSNFHWDCVFKPDGYAQTFAELGDMKNQISMRRKALDKFSAFLNERK